MTKQLIIGLHNAGPIIPRTVILKDGREVVIRFRSDDDAENLYGMYSSMSPEALEWVMAPYTRELFDRFISNLAISCYVRYCNHLSRPHVLPILIQFSPRSRARIGMAL
ncbi:hypothetical protein EU537_01660 [Candidatus Thorarchaeota archaeon]|nr:MAG: hypothetical protein EU537_01660 [Candidatus Thorarchaeota archaeon]